MTSFHVICSFSLSQSKILDTSINWGSPEKTFWNLFFFFFLENACACVLGPWPRAFLSLASRGSVLGKAVLGLGLGFSLCPWPRALCPRLHLWNLPNSNLTKLLILRIFSFIYAVVLLCRWLKPSNFYYFILNFLQRISVSRNVENQAEMQYVSYRWKSVL